MHIIEQPNHQQWDQKPEPFERHYSGPAARSDLLDTALVWTKLSENWLICRSDLAYFTMVTKSTNACYFGAHLLPKAWYVCDVTQLYVWNYFEYENKIWR